jgi:hypothetical protein
MPCSKAALVCICRTSAVSVLSSPVQSAAPATSTLPGWALLAVSAVPISVPEIHLGGDGAGQSGDTGRMVGGEGIAAVDHADQSLDDVAESARAALPFRDRRRHIVLDHQHAGATAGGGSDRNMLGLDHLHPVGPLQAVQISALAESSPLVQR